MTLAPGTRLGSHEIAAPLGAGGMGDVYNGGDTRPVVVQNFLAELRARVPW